MTKLSTASRPQWTSELNEMGVHVNNEREFPVFALGAKETAYDPSALVAGAAFLKLPKAVALSTLTTVVDLSTYRALKRCNLLVLHRAKGARRVEGIALQHATPYTRMRRVTPSSRSDYLPLMG